MKRNLETIFIYNSCMLKNVLTKDLNIKRILNLHYVIQNRHGFGMLMVKAQFSRVCPGGLDPCHIFLAHLHLDKCGYLKSLAWIQPSRRDFGGPWVKGQYFTFRSCSVLCNSSSHRVSYLLNTL